MLGARLRECCAAILPHLAATGPETILGPVDALKLKSSLEIFAAAVPREPLFATVLDVANRGGIGHNSPGKTGE